MDEPDTPSCHSSAPPRDTSPGPGGVLDFGLDGGVPPGPQDPNPCLEVKKVPMFRDFAQKMDPCLGIFWKFSGLAFPENFCDFDEKWTHV